MDILGKYIETINEDKKWIQNINMKKNSLHKDLNVPEDKKIPTKKLAIKPGDSDKLKKRKILAKTLIKIGKKRKLGESLTPLEEKVIDVLKYNFKIPHPVEANKTLIDMSPIIKYVRYEREKCKSNFHDEKQRNKCFLEVAKKSIVMMKEVRDKKCPTTKNPDICKRNINRELSLSIPFIRSLEKKTK